MHMQQQTNSWEGNMIIFQVCYGLFSGDECFLHYGIPEKDLTENERIAVENYRKVDNLS